MSLEKQELMDLYLKGQLTPEQDAAWQAMLAEDPQLEEEAERQRELMMAIRDERLAVLKVRLSQVDPMVGPGAESVAGGMTSALGGYLAAGLVAIGVIGGGYWLLNKDTKATVKQESETVVKTTEQPVPSQQAAQAPVAETPAAKVEEAPATKGTQVDPKPALRGAMPSQLKPESFHATEVPNAPNLGDDEDRIKADANVEEIIAPTGAMAKVNKNDVFIAERSEYKRHYAYVQGKVTLFGDYSGIVYDLIEFKGASSNRMFLKLDEDFYELKDGSAQPTPLVAIKDAKVIAAIQKRIK